MNDLNFSDLLDSDSHYYGLSNEVVKKLAYNIVKKFGYCKGGSNSTVGLLNDAISNDFDIEPASNEEIEKIDEFAKSIISSAYTLGDDDNYYGRNASLAWLKSTSTVRDFALICSFVNVYFKISAKREKEEKAKQLSNYVGNIGEKIIIDVAGIRVLYSKTFGVSYYNTILSYVYEITDKDGNIYIWSTSNEFEPNEVEKIAGTVKGHKEYKGKKQTVITRCKIIK